MFWNLKLKRFAALTALFLALAVSSARAQITYSSLSYCTSPTSFSGHCTSYDLLTTYLVNCSYSMDNFDTNHYGALTDYDYVGSESCGGCIQATGPGATTVIAVDDCPYQYNHVWCFSGSHHIDMSKLTSPPTNCAKYEVTAGNVSNNAAITWNFFECPLAYRTKKNASGNISYMWKFNTNAYWGEIGFFNNIFPIASAQQNYSGTWTNMTRQTYNFFECAGASEAPGNFPVTVRLTDVRGNSVTITTGTTWSPIQPSQTYYTSATYQDAGVQFPGCVAGPTSTFTKTYTPYSGPTYTFTRTNTPSPTRTPTGTPAPLYCIQFDDFEDGNTSNMYSNQGWFTYTWGTGATATSPTNVSVSGTGGAPGSTLGLQTGGSGASSSAGWGLTSNLAASGTVNLSSTMSGISFWVRTTAGGSVSMRFNVNTPLINTSTEGLWGTSFVATSTWTQVYVRTSAFDQLYGGGTTSLASALGQVSAFQWQSNSQTGTFTVQFDDICILTSTPIPTATCRTSTWGPTTRTPTGRVRPPRGPPTSRTLPRRRRTRRRDACSSGDRGA